jgi:threonine dehydrogenase-like Zn-dependent dehydrogenase
MRVEKAVLYGAGDLRLEESELDTGHLRSDEVLVETVVSAMSTGTELGNYEGRSTEVPGAPDYPRAIGYSNVGQVARVGPAVTTLTPGQRVFSLRPHQSAFLASEKDLLVPIPPAVPSESASLAYLTQLGVAALRQAGYQAGESVAVVGLGVIGLGTVAVARAMGARVIGVANSPLRADAARRMGAHTVLLSGDTAATPEADLVVLTANTWDAYRTSMDLARFGGRVSILGFPGRAQPAPAFNPLDARWLYAKQLTVLGAGFSPRVECASGDIRFNLRRNLEFLFGLMEDGRLVLDSLVTHRFPPARLGEAYELARQHSKDLIAAVFSWR